MNIPFELHVALRYLLAKRKQAFISVISLISTLGVTIGVMALVIALALMTGLQGYMRDRIVGSTAHVNVWNIRGITDYRAEADRLRALDHVVGAAPAITGEGLALSALDSAPIVIKGIDPALEQEVTDIRGAMLRGSLESLQAPEARDGIVLGSGLAETLGLQVGDTVSILTPQEMLTPNGIALRPPRLLRVAGIFSFGFYEFDAAYGYVTIPVAQRLLGDDRLAIQLRLDDPFLAPEVARAALDLAPEYTAQDWTVMNSELFKALGVEKLAISLAIGLIVMVAALNIVASLVLLVMEKHRDIGILKTMGASARSVTRIFMIQGLIIGVVGTAVGATAGYVAAYLLDRYRVIRLPADVYQAPYLPFEVLPLDFTLVVIGAVVICFLATIYPSRQAARLDPAQALRYE